jgi:hypothetical protein
MQYYKIKFKNDLPVVKNELSESFIKQSLIVIRQHPKFKSVEYLNHFHLVCLEQGSFVNSDHLPYVGKSNNKTIALIPASVSFTIVFHQRFFFGRIQNNHLYLASNEIELYDLCATPNLSQFSEQEKIIWHWLDSSQTSFSSLSLLYLFFPELPHPKFSQIHDLFLPSDLNDCKRTQLLLDKCPAIKSQLITQCHHPEQWQSILTNQALFKHFSSDTWKRWALFFQQWEQFEAWFNMTENNRHKKNQTQKIFQACLDFPLLANTTT